MIPVFAKSRAPVVALLAIACTGVAAAGCSSSSGSSAPKASGTVNVAYASSLQFLNEKIVSPAFTAADGYTFSGGGARPGSLEADIGSGEITRNVFESVGGDNVPPIEPKSTSWYIQHAGTAIV